MQVNKLTKSMSHLFVMSNNGSTSQHSREVEGKWWASSFSSWWFPLLTHRTISWLQTASYQFQSTRTWSNSVEPGTFTLIIELFCRLQCFFFWSRLLPPRKAIPHLAVDEKNCPYSRCYDIS